MRARPLSAPASLLRYTRARRALLKLSPADHHSFLDQVAAEQGSQSAWMRAFFARPLVTPMQWASLRDRLIARGAADVSALNFIEDVEELDAMPRFSLRDCVDFLRRLAPLPAPENPRDPKREGDVGHAMFLLSEILRADAQSPGPMQVMSVLLSRQTLGAIF